MKLDYGFEERVLAEIHARAEEGNFPPEILEELELLRGPQRFAALATPEQAAPRKEGALFRLRTVVNALENPSLLIQDHTFQRPHIALWADLLEAHRGAIEAALPAVGRIEIGSQSFGTGTLVSSDVVVTNRHVAVKFLQSSGTGWTWAPGLVTLTSPVNIDFRAEHDRTDAEEFALVDVLHVEPAPGPDLAFFRISTAGLTTSPLVFSSSSAGTQDAVVTVGYTSKEPGTLSPGAAAILLRLFGGLFNVKRLAPGRLVEVTAELLRHDCSVQGGNSGSPVLDLETGALLGLHFGGGPSNRAVPAAVIADQLSHL